AAPAVSAARAGDLNPASILAPATAAGGDVNGGSASLAGTTVQMGVAGGLVFNITYDSSVSSAPAGFTSAIADVVNYYESVFNDPITVNIDVGWGEVARQSLGGRARRERHLSRRNQLFATEGGAGGRCQIRR